MNEPPAQLAVVYGRSHARIRRCPSFLPAQRLFQFVEEEFFAGGVCRRAVEARIPSPCPRRTSRFQPQRKKCPTDTPNNKHPYNRYHATADTDGRKAMPPTASAATYRTPNTSEPRE